MDTQATHDEHHLSHRSNWLRAAVLGANDGIVSTGSLIVGVAAAAVGRPEILVAGIAGLVAGAMSMAAGEFVSVSSQSDTERADMEKERVALQEHPKEEHTELAAIYVGRGLDRDLADRVATQLMAHDALGAHMRDEVGLTEELAANPIQAAWASALSFAVGAALPLAVAALVPLGAIVPGVIAASVVSLALLGALSARSGGAPMGRAVSRVTIWGALAMAATAAIGTAIGAVI